MEDFNSRFNEYKLANGLHVALLDRSDRTINVRGIIQVYQGALHEQKGEEGLAHFLGHNVIRGGTKKYSPEEIIKIRTKFGDSNASTDHDKTVYGADMVGDMLETYLDYVSEIVFNPRFDKRSFEQQKQRVLREISQYRSDSEYADFREFKEKLYIGHPVLYDILGIESVVENSTIEKLKEMYQKGYNANNMRLLLSGKLPENIKELILKYFADKPAGKNIQYEFPIMEKSGNKAELYKPAPDLLNAGNPEQSNCKIALRIIVPPQISKDFYALVLLSNILGGIDGSRLFNSISENKGLTYHIDACYDGTKNVGVIDIAGSIISKRKEEAIDAIFEEISKLRAGKVTEDELDAAKRVSLYKIGQRLENNAGNMNLMLAYLDYKLTPEELMKNYKAVTSENILEAAQKFLPESRENGKYVLLVRDPLLQ